MYAGGGYLLWGIRGCAIFQGILFAPKFQSRISILKKNSKAGLYFAGKLSVEHTIYSQNQPCFFKSGKIYICIGKITENLGKYWNLGTKFWKKMDHMYCPKQGVFLAKFSEAGCQ